MDKKKMKKYGVANFHIDYDSFPNSTITEDYGFGEKSLLTCTCNHFSCHQQRSVKYLTDLYLSHEHFNRTFLFTLDLSDSSKLFTLCLISATILFTPSYQNVTDLIFQDIFCRFAKRNQSNQSKTKRQFPK